MATLIFACGFECGLLATHDSGASGGGSIDTVLFRTGLRSYRANPSASDETHDSPSVSSQLWVQRIYVRFASLPTTNTCLVVTLHGSTYAGAIFNSSDNKVYAGYNTSTAFTFGASGVTVTTGVWYRFDVQVNASANPWTIDVQVDGAAAAQLTNAVAASSSSRATIGAFVNGVGTTTADVYFDDWAVSQTVADYPLGAGHVVSSVPDADGTHNVAGANDFERTLTGVDITNATTDAYQLVNDVPLPTTAVDFINGIAPPNATDYVELDYASFTGETEPPNGVEAVVAFHDAGGAGANAIAVTLRHNTGATTANIFNGAFNVGATITYRRKLFNTIPGGGAWTLAAANDLRTRFLVTDASPDPYIDALMLEADFPDPVVAGIFPPYPMRRVHIN